MAKGGAYQYLTQPFDNREIPRLVEEALARTAARREQARLRREQATAPPRIIGVSRELFDHIELSARSASGTRSHERQHIGADRSLEQNITLRDLERECIMEVLRRTGCNKSRAAELLGLDRKTLYRRLDEDRAEGLRHIALMRCPNYPQYSLQNSPCSNANCSDSTSLGSGSTLARWL